MNDHTTLDENHVLDGAHVPSDPATKTRAATWVRANGGDDCLPMLGLEDA